MGRTRRVVVFGTFDLLHPGHLAFLTTARSLGTELVVVVSRDARVRREKGHAPVFDQRERLAMVRALGVVDKAILGDPPGRYGILRRLRPAVVAVGHDQRVPKDMRGPWTVRTLRAKHPARYRATRIRKILERLADG